MREGKCFTFIKCVIDIYFSNNGLDSRNIDFTITPRSSDPNH